MLLRRSILCRVSLERESSFFSCFGQIPKPHKAVFVVSIVSSACARSRLIGFGCQNSYRLYASYARTMAIILLTHETQNDADAVGMVAASLFNALCDRLPGERIALLRTSGEVTANFIVPSSDRPLAAPRRVRGLAVILSSWIISLGLQKFLYSIDSRAWPRANYIMILFYAHLDFARSFVFCLSLDIS
jgi:hypothetical protein